MIYKKLNYPEEGSFLICTVKKILPHSIFVDLDEYKNKEGYIHISEIAPGRIRNIRDYVKEGKKIVCKVLDINKEKGYIDLSLRRVSESSKQAKLEEFKQEERAEKILESVAKKLSLTLDDIYKKILVKVIDKYGLLNNFLQDISINGPAVLKDLALSQDISSALLDIVKEKIKQPEVSITYKISLSSYEPDGINAIKTALKKAEDLSKKNNYNIKIKYISAPKYMLVVTSDNYKSAEKISAEISNIIIEDIKKHKGTGSIEKIEK